MAMAKKGARTIIVDEVTYRWRIRGRPTYTQEMGVSNLSVAIEEVTDKGSMTALVVDTSALHPSSWMRYPSVSVTPVIVAAYIREALKRGWKPTQRGASFTLVADEEMLTG